MTTPRNRDRKRRVTALTQTGREPIPPSPTLEGSQHDRPTSVTEGSRKGGARPEPEPEKSGERCSTQTMQVLWDAVI